MSHPQHLVVLATRGSALALVQTNLVRDLCRSAFPDLQFEIKIIKTSGDKLQSVPPDVPTLPGSKGLFTKELEVALLNGEADLAVHSLKDLPTELPDGLELSAVLPREDVRDVLIFRNSTPSEPVDPASTSQPRGLRPGSSLSGFPAGATLATSSTRRQAQLLALRPDLKAVPIRGNVGTRLRKLIEQPELDGLILAAAGLKRLGYEIRSDGHLGTPKPQDSPAPPAPPAPLCATFLGVDEMVPCVGQGAIGIEGRIGDARLAPIFAHLNDPATEQCVAAERSFLLGMGGGCLSPIAAYAQIEGGELRLRAVSFRTENVRRTEQVGPPDQAARLGQRAARDLNAKD